MKANPSDQKARYFLALDLYNQGQITSAIEVLSLAPAKDFEYESAYLLGELHLAANDLLQAAKSFDAALEVNETYEANFQLGLIFSHIQKYENAEIYFEKALKLNPDLVPALINMGAIFRNIGKFTESLQRLDKALELDNADPAAWLNKGVTLDSMGNLQDAIGCYEKALSLDGGYLEAYSNKGNAELGLGRLKEAHDSFQKALRIFPGDADTLSNYSVLKLAEANFSDGWRDYESRFYCSSRISNPFKKIPKLESLANLADKKILVWAEQGLGDTIQFYRYLENLSKFSQHITLAVQSELKELLAAQPLNIQVLNIGEVEAGGFDYQSALMSLPYLFKTNIDTIPAEIPYIQVDDNKVSWWKQKIANHSGLKVGLVWSGGYKKDPNLWAMNERRNIPFSSYYPFSNIENISYFCLQKGEGLQTPEYLEKNRYWTKNNFFDYTDLLNSFSDTAALIKNLDLVITVDTSMAHLSGALGKSVWILNRFDSCWRWLKNTNLSPWYPTAKIYTQHEYQNWEKVIHEVQGDLTQLAKDGA
ncbi:tetratricopeptide repeat protein [Polynucleobacter yangtzensis]|uniref:tetratricopeptide repeat-containing glycosyltransferase family protein n=1 Tax=Polynucleobacter yangtzensis TaxID=1743159 RepID=UPI000831E790|nr:tetratricopeptide repeat protein [Polynucleobacter yangtzensis]